MKRLTFTLLVMCLVIMAHAQATYVTVDCQLAGWLSSQLNPKDIPTMEYLTVRGNVNSTDVKTIGRLFKEYKLRHVDLSDVNMVAEGGYTDGEFSGDMFDANGDSLRYLALPKNLIKLSSAVCWGIIDTLEIGSSMYKSVVGEDLTEPKAKGYGGYYQWSNYIKVRHLIVREGADNICMTTLHFDVGPTTESNEYLVSVHLPNSMKVIKARAFKNFKNLRSINLPDSIQDIYYDAFKNTKIKIAKDTIRIPQNMRYLHMYAGLNSLYKGEGGQITTIYLPESIDSLDVSSDNYLGKAILDIHVKKTTPPIFLDGGSRVEEWENKYRKYLQYCTVYVPVGSGDKYRNTYPWSNATIIEESISPTNVVLSDSVLYFSSIGESKTLIATVLPEDADNKNVTWTSTNPSVCIIAGNGNVFSTGFGEAIVIASTVQGGKIATCKVKVQNTTGINQIAEDFNSIADFYDINGQKILKPVKGLNIIKHKGQKAKKVIIK